MAVRLFDKSSRSEICEISNEDFQIITDHMEEESSTDADYFVDPMAVDALERLGASASVVDRLRSAIGSSEGIDITWARSDA